MNRLLIAAAGIAVATAEYSYDYSLFANDDNKYFDFDLMLSADAWYTTTYEGADGQEQSGFKIDSYVTLELNFEFF